MDGTMNLIKSSLCRKGRRGTQRICILYKRYWGRIIKMRMVFSHPHYFSSY